MQKLAGHPSPAEAVPLHGDGRHAPTHRRRGADGWRGRNSARQVVVQVISVGGLLVPVAVPMKPNVVEPPAGNAPL